MLIQVQPDSWSSSSSSNTTSSNIISPLPAGNNTTGRNNSYDTAEQESFEFIDLEGYSLNDIVISEDFLFGADNASLRPDGRKQIFIDFAETVTANRRERSMTVKPFFLKRFNLYI